MKLSIDKSKCMGCGTCMALYPEIFDIGEDGLAIIKPKFIQVTDEEIIKKIRTAQESCPTGAITLE